MKMRDKMKFFLAMAAMAERLAPDDVSEKTTCEKKIAPKKLKKGQLLFFVDNGRLIQYEGATEYYEDGTDWVLARTEKAAMAKARKRNLI